LLELDLWGNQLTGEIPPEIGNLTNLEILDLGDNQLTGEIPDRLGEIQSLQYLALNDNRLSGVIPTSITNRLWYYLNLENPPYLAQEILDQQILLAKPFSLDLSGNFADLNEDTLTYNVTGLPNGLKYDPNTGLIDGQTDVKGTYNVTVIATDDDGWIVDDFNLVVTDVNKSPTITSGNNPNVEENTTAVTRVTATDPENDTLSYSLSGGADLELFTINTTTGLLNFISAPDFENPRDSDANNLYFVQVSASDGINPAVTQNLTVTVTDQPEKEDINLGDDGGTFDFSDRTNNLNISCGSGNYNITCGSGNDNIDIGGGNNIINAGAGDDIIAGSGLAGTDNQIDGGEGFDTVTYEGDLANFSVTLKDGIVKVGSNTDTLTNVEQLQFTDQSILVENLADTPVLDVPLFRFQNTLQPGTYLFVGEEERQSVLANYTQFVEEGQAFKVGVEPDDDLIVMNRFQNSLVPGTYLYAGEEESISIRANYPNFIEEGIAFYAYPGGVGKGIDFYRFQNTLVPGTYLFVGGEERQNILANFPNFVEEGVAFEAFI
jgi:hypothetical protein